MIRYCLAFSGVLCFAAIGAFFLFVPPLLIVMVWVATVVLALTGYALLYCFGVQPVIQPALTAVDIDRQN